MDKKFINVSAPFPLRLERTARIVAARNGISRSELVRRAVEAYVAAWKKKTVESGDEKF